jgi:hypothetical protein
MRFKRETLVRGVTPRNNVCVNSKFQLRLGIKSRLRIKIGRVVPIREVRLVAKDMGAST